MGQHASSESVNHLPEVTTMTQRVAGGVSEDETMVDASSTSSVFSAQSSRTSPRTVSMARIFPLRSRTSSTSNGVARTTRRSSLWCRAQGSLRNRGHRATASIDIPDPPRTISPQVTRSTSSNPLSLFRRNTHRNSTSSTPASTRTSEVFSRPISSIERDPSVDPPDPFTHNIDPSYEPPEERRPAPFRRRSIWEHLSHPRPPTPTPPTSTPAVIDHSTQTSEVGHTPQPFNITRRPGEDQAEMLSRFLYVAGAALAASLVGSTDTTAAQLQDFSADFADTSDDSGDAPEGSFEGFLRALRQGRTQFAHALRNDTDITPGEGSNSAFTYLLMYRFHATSQANTPPTEADVESSTEMALESPTTPSPSVESTSPTNQRMIPFVIIGVQPVPPRDSERDGSPSFSEGVASLLANARSNPTNTRPTSRPTTSSTSISSDTRPFHATQIPGSWRDTPPPDLPRRRASVDGSFSRENLEREPLRENTTRAWQMYIYGGAYPENHLIFTAPSLFTDSPSSEDMLLLASVLGEVKPPVASKEEILAAGGISKVGQDITPIKGDRCLVCLSDYEQDEECRTLSGCGHLFHKECIDQWLVSGRNACPLCRGIGVATKDSKTESVSATDGVEISVAQ